MLAFRSSDSARFAAGIFGNSVDVNEPSWQIVGAVLRNYTSAGVSTDSSSELNDYPFTTVHSLTPQTEEHPSGFPCFDLVMFRAGVQR